jgi:hypothetical protein
MRKIEMSDGSIVEVKDTMFDCGCGGDEDTIAVYQDDKKVGNIPHFYIGKDADSITAEDLEDYFA